MGIVEVSEHDLVKSKGYRQIWHGFAPLCRETRSNYSVRKDFCRSLVVVASRALLGASLAAQTLLDDLHIGR